MTRLLIDCSNVFHNPGVNSGIQRVVRNIVRELPAATTELECVAVIMGDGQLYRVRSLLPDFKRTSYWLYRTYSLLDRVKHAYLRRYHRVLMRFPLSQYRGFRRLVHLLAYLPIVPIWLGLKLLDQFGGNPINMRAQPFEPCAGDQLLLLDSSWQPEHFRQIEQLQAQGIGIVAVVYDLIPLTHPQFFESRLQGLYSDWFAWVVERADGFMAISQAVRDELKDEVGKRLGLGRAAQRWFGYFHLGAELDLITNDDKPSPALQAVFSQNTPVFLAVSTLEPRKNHAYLLDAFECAWLAGSQARLCIIGKVGWKCEALVERIYQHRAFGTQLFFFDDVDDVGLEFAYNHASALVFASHAEGFGLPLVEAMQRGLPAMGSDLPVFHEIGQAYMAYFDLEQPQSLTDLVLQFERTGHFPAEQPLQQWQWISWRDSAEQLVQGVSRKAYAISP